MATVNDIDRWLDITHHPVLGSRFNQDQQRQLLTEDMFAGKSVSSLLVAVVTVGAVLMLATVLWIVAGG